MHSESQASRPAGVARMAVDIANYLTTRTSTKKHGGYNYYEDDRIHISLDTYVPNITVTITPGVTVFSAAYHNWAIPDTFRPGAWIDHVAALAEQAALVKRKRREEQERQEREHQIVHFAPVDDAALFSDVAGSSSQNGEVGVG